MGAKVVSDPCGLTAAGAKSVWVYPQGSVLGYKQLNSTGDQIMDFSAAGYGGGGVALPSVPVKANVSCPSSSGDDTDQTQAALNNVSQLPLTNGSRGAVVLAAGNYTVKKPLSSPEFPPCCW